MLLDQCEVYSDILGVELFCTSRNRRFWRCKWRHTVFVCINHPDGPLNPLRQIISFVIVSHHVPYIAHYALVVYGWEYHAIASTFTWIQGTGKMDASGNLCETLYE